MKRRTFLKHTAVAGATAMMAGSGPSVHAADKAGTKNPVIGEGEFRYECIHNWGQLPDSIKWQTSHGVAVDAAGLIYMTHMGLGNDVMDTVVVFDAKGMYVRSFGKEWHKGGHGIDIRKEGAEEFIYLSHMTDKGPVVKTTLKGEIVWKKETPEEPGVYNDKARFRPTNIAFTPDGGFYVGDGYGSNYIHQYNKDAKWVRTWGGFGDEPGKMKTPHGIWLDDRPGREPSLVVADRANARLQYFSLDGKHIGFVNDLLFPAHFDIRGEVLLVPDLHARVSLFDKNNKPIVHLGDDPEWRKIVLDGFKVRTDESRWQPGKFVHPHDACFDKDGNIFVIEWVQTGRVTLLRHVS
ncbi:MAG: twin-arginine translocation signal domain-containing protein [Planctomycetes bacterium]|nr:twin-arginine translocation signal domain-containing protein [Planctomycetota bacterium]